MMEVEEAEVEELMEVEEVEVEEAEVEEAEAEELMEVEVLVEAETSDTFGDEDSESPDCWIEDGRSSYIIPTSFSRVQSSKSSAESSNSLSYAADVGAVDEVFSSAGVGGVMEGSSSAKSELESSSNLRSS